MPPSLILYPVFAMILLTFIVWIIMYRARVAAIRRERIKLSELRTRERAVAAFPDWALRPSDNFQNLFELPVLFYTLVAFLYATQSVDILYLGLAWAFVGLRAVHSAIHITYNNVLHRFYVYVTSGFILFGAWLRLAYDTFVAA